MDFVFDFLIGSMNTLRNASCWNLYIFLVYFFLGGWGGSPTMQHRKLSWAGIQLVPPALKCRVLTTGSPGKSKTVLLSQVLGSSKVIPITSQGPHITQTLERSRCPREHHGWLLRQWWTLNVCDFPVCLMPDSLWSANKSPLCTAWPLCFWGEELESAYGGREGCRILGGSLSKQ